MNEKNHEKAVETILTVQDRIDEKDIECMNRSELLNIINGCEAVYNTLGKDVPEIAKINKYRQENNIKGEKPIIRIDFLLDTFFQAYETLANLKYPAVYDEPNIVPEETEEREYINKAINKLEEFIEYFPEDVDSLFNLGTLYCRIEKYSKAIDPLEKANELNPAEDIQKNLDYANKKFCEKVQENKVMNKIKLRHIPMEHKGWC